MAEKKKYLKPQPPKISPRNPMPDLEQGAKAKAEAARSRIHSLRAYKTTNGKIFELWDDALKEQIEIDALESGRGFLPWKYCECGCHGFELNVTKGCYYWCHVQLEPSTKYHLHSGHGFTGEKLGIFRTWREVDDALAPIIKANIEAFNRDSQAAMNMIKAWEAQRAISNRY